MDLEQLEMDLVFQNNGIEDIALDYDPEEPEEDDLDFIDAIEDFLEDFPDDFD